jgi:hypothetical protein
MDLYDIIEEIKKLFEAEGFTCFDAFEFDGQQVTRLPETSFPALFIGRGSEEIDNEASPTECLIERATIDLNIVFNTGKAGLIASTQTALRKVKNVIYENQSTQNWSNWILTDNFVAQLANTNDKSVVFGGVNINTAIEYREERIKPIVEV